MSITAVFICCLPLLLSAQRDSLSPQPAPLLGIPEVFLQDFRLDGLTGEQGLELYFKNSGQNGTFSLSINEEPYEVVFEKGESLSPIILTDPAALLLMEWVYEGKRRHRLYHISELANGSTRIRHIPLWLSIIPPLIAIGLALLLREVVVSLFVGIWAGAFIAGGLRLDAPFAYLYALWEVVERYIVGALNDTGHLSVIVFSLLIGGMVAIIARNGGMTGVVNALSRYARTPRSAQFITWLLGVAIFFDDYANTLIVGNTMRSVTDRFRVSREKLAYIVDSTAAPVAAVAFITTWIGAELGYIAGGIDQLAGFPFDASPYALFLQSLKYSFYPILTLAFILMLVWLQRDYGPMWAAERRARQTGRVSPALHVADDEPDMEDLSPVAGAPNRWYHAAIPVLAVILMTIYGLLDTGFQTTYRELLDSGSIVASNRWTDIWAAMQIDLGEEAHFFRQLGRLIGNADSYVALLWSSLTGVALAVVITVSNRIMNLFFTMDTMIRGFKTMMPAVIILTLAWALAITTEELHTAQYLTSILEGNVAPWWMPGIIFVLAALIAFSTGSSWSTMAILYPIAIPTTWAVCQAQGLDPGYSLELLLNVIAVVLAASVLGDHCSPISDTTILSSLASDCNHIDHVRTQLPYALTVGVVSLVATTISAVAGGGWGLSLLCLVTGLGVLWVAARFWGKPHLNEGEIPSTTD